jgi:hypothetical protein
MKTVTVEIAQELYARVLESIKIVAQHGVYISEAAPAYDIDAMAEFLPYLIHATEE